MTKTKNSVTTHNELVSNNDLVEPCQLLIRFHPSDRCLEGAPLRLALTKWALFVSAPKSHLLAYEELAARMGPIYGTHDQGELLTQTVDMIAWNSPCSAMAQQPDFPAIFSKCGLTMSFIRCDL